LNAIRKGIVPIAIVAVVISAIAFFSIGRLTSQPATTLATPTATVVVPTATPNLVLRAPHVLATFMEPFNQAGPVCNTCLSLTFTANGPFDMIASCNPFQVFADSLPSYQLQLFNSTGHLLDTVQESCGDPNNDVSKTIVVPERLEQRMAAARQKWRELERMAAAHLAALRALEHQQDPEPHREWPSVVSRSRSRSAAHLLPGGWRCSTL
jgi:hypothetical protein